MPTLPCPFCEAPRDAAHRFCPSCGASLAGIVAAGEDPLIGVTLPGGYLVVERVGEGPMGYVYRAEQKSLGRVVAVKVLHPSLRGDAAASARFLNEARAAARFNHPNSVTVFDFGKTGETLYLVMEYLRGWDCASLLIDKGPPELRRAAEILVEVLSALAEAHHAGVIHRDLKPENIVLEPLAIGGSVAKVVDYGLARLIGAEPPPGSADARAVWGTSGYTAPEVLRGEPASERSDIYACGVILFVLLTGCFPFAEGEAPAERAPDPRTVAPERGISAELAEVTLKALEFDPALRFDSARAFAGALRVAMPPESAPVAPKAPKKKKAPARKPAKKRASSRAARA